MGIAPNCFKYRPLRPAVRAQTGESPRFKVASLPANIKGSKPDFNHPGMVRLSQPGWAGWFRKKSLSYNRHRTGQHEKNRAEVSYQHTREQER